MLPRISFVVLSHNSTRVLERCVDSLVAQSDYGQDEIWVVENGSTDGSVDLLKSLAGRYQGVVHPLYLERNHGTTVSRNMALERARGRYVAIVDSDVQVPPQTVLPLLARLNLDLSVGLVAPRLMYPDGRLQLSVDTFPTLPHKVKRLVALRDMERRFSFAERRTDAREVDYAIAAFWLLRRDVIDRVGLLDERIFYAPEDVDYCLRIWKAGYRVLYDPTVYAIHDAQEISRTLPWRRASINHARGLGYYFTKHSCWLSLRDVRRAIRSSRTASGLVSNALAASEPSGV